MKEKKLNMLSVVIIILSLIVGIETLSIIKSVFSIKGENIKLSNELHILNEKNNELIKNNELLNKIILEHSEPKITPPDVPNGWKVYRFLNLGYEIAYPHYYKDKITEGKDIPGHPQIASRLYLYSDDPKADIEINAVNLKKFSTIYEYINGMYQNKIYVKKDIEQGIQKYSLYKMQGEKHYYIIFKSREYIFDINSPSEELLLKVAAEFKFI